MIADRGLGPADRACWPARGCGALGLNATPPRGPFVGDGELQLGVRLGAELAAGGRGWGLARPAGAHALAQPPGPANAPPPALGRLQPATVWQPGGRAGPDRRRDAASPAEQQELLTVDVHGDNFSWLQQNRLVYVRGVNRPVGSVQRT
jgi:hypothetical protein